MTLALTGDKKMRWCYHATMPVSVPTAYHQAEQLFQQGNLDTALSLCRQMLQQTPHSAEGHFLMAKLLRNRREFAPALQHAQTAVSLRTHQPRFLQELGHCYLCVKSYDQATANLQKALALDPSLNIAALLLGDIQTQQGDYAAAEATFRQLIRRTDMPEAHEHLGLCYQAQNKLDDAEAAFQIVIARKPEYFWGYSHMGKILASRARLYPENTELTGEAETMFRKAVTLNPKAHEAHAYLAILLHSRGNNTEALHHATQAVELQPQNIKLLMLFSTLCMYEGKLQPAIDACREVLRMVPDHLHAMQSLARLLIPLGQQDEALKLVDAVLAHDPENESMQHTRASLTGERPKTAPENYVASLFDSYADSFDAHLQEKLAYTTPTKAAALLSRLINEGSVSLPEKASLLDLGCGTGLCALALEPLTGNREGVDLSPRMVEKAAERGLYDRLETGEVVAYLKGSDRTYDIIAALDVVVYIGDLAALFEQTARRLNPEGVFILSTEVGDDAPPYVLRPSGRFAHATSYINELAETHGLRILGQEKSDLRKEAAKTLEGYLYVIGHA